jgi:hypothetical protein
VPTGLPFIDLNSEIFVVMRVRLSIAIIPIAKQIMLETKARANQSIVEKRKSDGTAIALTSIKHSLQNDISLLTAHAEVAFFLILRSGFTCLLKSTFYP